MQQTVTRRYASPAAFELDLQKLASRGWTVRGVDQEDSKRPRSRRALIVSYGRGDDEMDWRIQLHQPEPSGPRFDFKVPWLASRWGKALAAAGVALVIMGFVMTGHGAKSASVAAEGITIQALGPVDASQLPDPQAVVYSRDLKSLLSSYGSSFDTLASLSAKPQMSSGAWQSQLRRTTEALRGEDAQLRALVAPACLSALHAQLLDAATGIEKAAERIDGAVRVQSTSSVEQWSQAALSVGGAMKDVSGKVAAAKC